MRWIDGWVARDMVEIKVNGKLYKDNEELLFTDAIERINCDFTANKPHKTTLNYSVLRDALSQKIKLFVKQHKKEVVSGFRYKQDLDDNLSKFCNALTCTDSEVIKAVVYHFIWQVKRKMFGLEVDDHLMLIIYGPQGIGKSRAIKKLLSPIQGFYAPAKFTHITDGRESRAFEQNFVMFFDEMQGATRTDIDNIKEKLTCDYVSYRPLFTNDQVLVKNNCTFIGSSNKPLYEMIRDNTGMRRFYEIRTDKCDWDVINSIDYNALWLGVDEDNDIPATRAYEAELKAQQEENREKHTIELWAEENEITTGTVRNEVNDLFSHYCNFCVKGNFRAETKTWFGKRLIELLKVTYLRSNGKSYYFLNKKISIILPNFSNYSH